MRTGLVSVTFRGMQVEEIAALCEKARLKAVEWGGDVHVPPDDEAAAKAARAACDRHGLFVSSYGSYFRLGQDTQRFVSCVAQAQRLQAGVLRIWAGRASEEADDDARRDMVRELIRLSDYAAKRGVRTALEFHGGTLTDTRESAVRLMQETREAEGKLVFYWQPRWDWTEEERLRTLSELRPRLSHTHVFTWRENGDRLPLKDGEAMWKKALPLLNPDACALIEFVQGDDPENLLRDAATLNGWLCGDADA